MIASPKSLIQERRLGARRIVSTLAFTSMLIASACASSGSGSGSGGAGGTASGSGGSSGGGGTQAGTGGTTAGSGGNNATGGSGVPGTGGADAGVMDAPAETATPDAAGDVVNGTPDGGAYSRVGWTAQSMPPFPTGVKAMGQDLKYANALDGNIATRWSIGDTNSPAQTIGDQFTLDMKERHVFTKVLFWSGGPNGMGGPDPRDYPGALDLSVSDDCVTFGATLASGTEPQPGCSGNAGSPCNMPFVITLPQPATARCVRLTLTQRLKLGGGIWWAIDEIYVYP
jgi:F5/8 type C domain